MQRRNFMKVAASAAGGMWLVPLAGAMSGQALAQTPPAGPFTLGPLGYGFDALEPHIDAATMRIHHGTHHAAYVRNLNAIAAQHPALGQQPMEKVLADISSLPEAIRDGVRNNMGGHWNHTFFWSLMQPGGAMAPSGRLRSEIDASFGSVVGLQEAVNKAALGRFGSGWAWLGVGADKKLAVFATPYQDTPHMVTGMRGAVLGVDVWEHAYYLKHQAGRANYLKDWWNVVNWDVAGKAYDTLAG